MAPNEMIEAATRVLGAFTRDCQPDPTDVETLKEALPLDAELEPDELACRIIRDLGYVGVRR